MTKRILIVVAAAFVLAAIAPTGADAQTPNYNTRYGETRFTELPQKGVISKKIWVGSWWAYKRNGIAFRWDDSVPRGDATVWGTERLEGTDAAKLSPAEKYDALMGRTEQIEYAKIEEYLKKHYEVESDVTDKIEERRELIYKLNSWIEENADEDWKETDDGKRYLELTEEIDEAKEGNEVELTKDTATEFEIMDHGTGQFGVESWYGHCNAWAATAIVDEEPVQDTVVEDITFTAADVKALLTEAWMELRSSFHGSRNNYDKDSKSKEAVNFQDVTPAAFHIFFADQIGNKDRSFVIDRYTGSQVWNQPVKGFRVLEITPQYTTPTDEEGNATGEPEGVEVELKETRYDYQGTGKVEVVGTETVFPVLFKTTIHWVTDGLPHDRLTVDYDANIDDETFTSSHRVGQASDHQIEIRTLNYTLWLDRPMDDPEARIVGDGEWNHGDASSSSQLHPDFMWQPLANTPSSPYRQYENPYIAYEVITDRLLPGSLPTPPAPTRGTYSATAVPTDIPDNTPEGISVTLNVPDSLIVGTMTATVEITHTYIGDLTIDLVGPDGQTREIKARYDGGSTDDYASTVDVREWIGSDAAGDWTLKVADHAGIDTGAVTRFEIEVESGVEPTQPTGDTEAPPSTDDNN